MAAAVKSDSNQTRSIMLTSRITPEVQDILTDAIIHVSQERKKVVSQADALETIIKEWKQFHKLVID